VLHWPAYFVYDVFYVYVNILMALLTDLYIYIWIYIFGVFVIFTCVFFNVFDDV
jgi:hypothetical protein